MLLYLAFKNVISKKSSFVIVLFIAFAIMMLVVTNSVFDSTERGVQQTFVSSFAGDIVIRPRYNAPLSLFGDETPVTGKHTELPKLLPFDEIEHYLLSNEKISHVVPQITGLCAMSSDSKTSAAFLFGIPVEKYLSCMNAIRILEGEQWQEGQKGILISKKLAEKMSVSVGDTLQFMIEEGFSSRIRAAPVTAIYEYAVDNAAMDKIVLVNPETVRSIMGMSELTSAEDLQLSEQTQGLLEESDIDNLFADAGDLSDAVVSEAIHEQDNSEVLAPSEELYTESSSWNFIICRVYDSKHTALTIKSLNRYFKDNDWPVEAVNWRSSAGNTAFYLYVLRLILNVGIIIILMAGFIVVNNTLVINVLDRIREIGTMRAIGANKRYITKECAAETLILSSVAGVFGCVFGIIASAVITTLELSFSNSFIIQLFGGSVLKTTITVSNIAGSFGLAVFLGLIAWIYPVINALRANPVQAMQGAK